LSSSFSEGYIEIRYNGNMIGTLRVTLWSRRRELLSPSSTCWRDKRLRHKLILAPEIFTDWNCEFASRDPF
jgi:hypothetical protein